VGLFLAGVSFCYFFVLARALRFAEVFALWVGVRVPDWRAETYLSFVTKFMLGMGLGFELPVVLLALVKIGILDYQRLKAARRYMIVINLILGALLTTPEVFTQVVMAIVLQLLYEVSVWIAWYWERQEKKREAIDV
jgi:sec-independent protein translocase protein TatC